MRKSFGPAVTISEGRPPRTSCITRETFCFLLDRSTCRDQKPPREIPDTAATPDWCKYRAGIEQDVADESEMRALGLLSKDRRQLSDLIKALPVEARGTCSVAKRPWKLPEMNADMMRHALLRAWRKAQADG